MRARFSQPGLVFMNTMAGRMISAGWRSMPNCKRLRRFEDRLRKFEPEELNARNGIDVRILQAAIANELFEFQDVHKFERNPMTYAHCADLNIYIARNFAPLEDRVRSLIQIEAQIPNILIAGKTNLEAVLPRPHIELAIQIARGSADFLRKDMVTAVGSGEGSGVARQFYRCQSQSRYRA